jgi:hypothetical protein
MSMLEDDLRAAAAADRELGRDFEPAVLDSFVERLGREIDARVDARLAQRRAPTIDLAGLVLALGSLGIALGIPGAMHDKFGGFLTFAMTVFGWLVILAINVAYARRR